MEWVPLVSNQMYQVVQDRAHAIVSPAPLNFPCVISRLAGVGPSP